MRQVSKVVRQGNRGVEGLRKFKQGPKRQERGREGKSLEDKG